MVTYIVDGELVKLMMMIIMMMRLMKTGRNVDGALSILVVRCGLVINKMHNYSEFNDGGKG